MGFIEQRRAEGKSSGTVSREIAVVRRVLTLASRYWRDEQGKPWLPTAPPMFRLPNWNDKKKTYPLTWEEQTRLINRLPAHLADMTVFALNTGARESLIANLQWAWEQKIKELDRTLFIVPGEYTKNGTDCILPLNRRAEAIIETRRGLHDTHVFTYEGEPILRIHNSGWKKAWKESGLPMDKNVSKGPHSLRHTFARRLRSAMVPHETIAALLHHIDGNVTLNYAPAQLEDMFKAVDSILEQKTLLRAVV